MTTATEMKRSTKDILYVTPHDFNLALDGVKTATSRLGDRRDLWPVGSKVLLVDNEFVEATLALRIEIVYNVLMLLGEIKSWQAGNIGGYSVEDHWDDFTLIYSGSDIDTVLSLVGFRLL